jgi:2C-methyl-D-erythritol 2,4-cyclodiphosphate synthase
MADTGGAATEAVSQIAGAVDKLGALVQQVERRHLETSKMLEELVRKSNSSLEAVSQRLVGDRQKLLELEEQSRRSVAESVRAQEAAVNVLTSMTSLARGLTEALEAASGNDGHGKR